MKCPSCSGSLTEVFLTLKCDWCDFGPGKDAQIEVGFVVLPTVSGCDDPFFRPETYLFATELDATRWLTSAGYSVTHIVKRVKVVGTVRWHLSRGTLRDCTLATQMYEVWPDWKYNPHTGHRAYLAPE